MGHFILRDKKYLLLEYYLPTMKATLIFFVLLFNAILSHGQKSVYTTTGGEWIFSWANAKSGGLDVSTITRFSPVINIQSQAHYDLNDKFGFFSGLSLRNVGFIYDDPSNPNTRYKARTYTIGIPLALKVGNMTRTFLFGGYEIEFPFNFKEKKFVNEEKVDKSTSWFSNKTPGVYHTVFVGFQSPQGTQLKFKYYMTNFFNKDYAANDGSGGVIYPYQNFDANVFYISLSFQILKGTDFYYKRPQ